MASPKTSQPKERQITQANYEQLLVEFRRHPGAITKVAQACGIAWRTAKRAWDRGWTPQRPWAKAIKLVLEDEAELIRAERIKKDLDAQRAEEDRRVAARMDAIQARKEEAEGAKASRRNAIGLAVVSNKLLTAALVMCDELTRRVNDPAEMKAMTVAEMRSLFDMISRGASRSVLAFRYALEVERIIAGEPIATIGVRVDKMSPEQLVGELQGMARTLARAGKLNSSDFDDPLLSDPLEGMVRDVH